MGEASSMNLKEWQKKKRLSDSDILTKEHLNRIKSEPVLVRCACGCGEWRVRYDKNGIKRRYIKGHVARGRKLSAETLQKIRETRQKGQESSEKRRLMRKYGPKIEKLFSKKEEK